jgi:dTDP-4-dehydrorhamnose 3,5-epimerase
MLQRDYNTISFAEIGIGVDFVQNNQSISSRTGTIRGLHFQIPPMAQAKLVRIVKGSVLDVAVDLRHKSPTYTRHVRRVLSAANEEQLFLPPVLRTDFVRAKRTRSFS